MLLTIMQQLLPVIDLIARGGGGGSGGGGGGGGILVIPVILIGMLITWHKRKQRIKNAELAQQTALKTDSSWHDDIIEKTVEKTYYRFEEDWSKMDVESIKHYLTPSYYEHMALVLGAMKEMDRRNDLTNIKLVKQVLFGVNDSRVDELDSFNVEVTGSLKDLLVRASTGEQLHADSSSFTEIWHFEREGKQWALANITQINKDGLVYDFDPVIDTKYAHFAKHNGFYYNADFGWLLLPFEGHLFSDSAWGLSDINHHVIGRYKNVIVQFFEYTPLMSQKARFWDNFHYLYRSRSKFAKYTIAKATLPKNYERIIVSRRPAFSFASFTPSGLRQVSLESADFNNHFDVFATDLDKVNSLELLHPAFMEKLLDLPFRVSLEIVGQTLYFYTTDKDADYQMMLELLQEAFHEMKM